MSALQQVLGALYIYIKMINLTVHYDAICRSKDTSLQLLFEQVKWWHCSKMRWQIVPNYWSSNWKSSVIIISCISIRRYIEMICRSKTQLSPRIEFSEKITDGTMLFKALKVEEQFCAAVVVGREASVAHITLALYDHVLNTTILCGQRNFAHTEVWKFGNQADCREGYYNSQVLMTQMNG